MAHDLVSHVITLNIVHLMTRANTTHVTLTTISVYSDKYSAQQQKSIVYGLHQ